MSTSRVANQPAVPWWRVGMVWLVVGGPLAVVIAATATAVIAIRGADPVVTVRGIAADGEEASTQPALQARNHAAAPLPAPARTPR
jgi:hypothetical protein